MSEKILIRKTKLFCPFCGKKLRKYAIRTDILHRCYAYCSACKKEYSVTIFPEDKPNNVEFWWKEGEPIMLDTIRKKKKK